MLIPGTAKGLTITELVFLLFTIVSFVYDLRSRKLNNWFSLIGIALAMALHLYTAGLHGFILAFAGAAVGFAAAFPIYVVKAFGAGDVKWFAAAGAFLGAVSAMVVLAGAVLVTGIAGICAFAVSSRFRKRCLMMGTALYYQIGLQALSKQGKTRFPFMASVLPVAIWFVACDPY